MTTTPDVIDTELQYILARESGDSDAAEHIRRAWEDSHATAAERAESLRFVAWCAILSPGIALWTYLIAQLVR